MVCLVVSCEWIVGQVSGVKVYSHLLFVRTSVDSGDDQVFYEGGMWGSDLRNGDIGTRISLILADGANAGSEVVLMGGTWRCCGISKCRMY